MKKTSISINRDMEGLKRAKMKLPRNYRKKHVEGRLLAVRNIASEALKDFIYNEYEGIGK